MTLAGRVEKYRPWPTAIQGAEGDGRARDARVQARRTAHPRQRPQGEEPQAGDRHRPARGGRLEPGEPEEEPGEFAPNQGQGTPGRDRAGPGRGEEVSPASVPRRRQQDQGVLREPDRQASTLAQGRIVLGPVRHPAPPRPTWRRPRRSAWRTNWLRCVSAWPS